MTIFPDQEQEQGTLIAERRGEAFQQQEQYVAWGLGSTLPRKAPCGALRMRQELCGPTGPLPACAAALLAPREQPGW